MKLPAFQFYPGDWRKDPGVQALSYEERGIWLEILCLMHESEERGKLLLGGKPYPTDRLARVLGLSAEVMGKVISDLITLNVASLCDRTKALTCRRMVRDEELRQTRAKGGKNGGNPQFRKGKPNPYYNLEHNLQDNLGHKQKITPSSSSSISSSINAQTESGMPTLTEVKAYASMHGVKPDDAEQFWHHFESAGWVDKNGNQIKRWQSKLMTWKTNAAASVGGFDSKKRQPFVSELKAVLEAKRTLRDKIKNRGHENALGWTAANEEDRKQFAALNREIGDLIEKIARATV